MLGRNDKIQFLRRDENKLDKLETSGAYNDIWDIYKNIPSACLYTLISPAQPKTPWNWLFNILFYVKITVVILPGTHSQAVSKSWCCSWAAEDLEMLHLESGGFVHLEAVIKVFNTSVYIIFTL